MTSGDRRHVANEDRRQELLRWMLKHPLLSLTAAEIKLRVTYLYQGTNERAIRTYLESLAARELVVRDGKKWGVCA